MANAVPVDNKPKKTVSKKGKLQWDEHLRESFNLTYDEFGWICY